MAGLAITAPSHASASSVDSEAEQLTAAQVENDLDDWLEWTNSTHPKLDYSADPAVIMAAAEAIRASLPDRMSRIEAWRQMARLNNVLNDAHMGLVIPIPEALEGTRQISFHLREAALEVVDGGGIVPDGASITRIGDMAVGDMLSRLLPLVRGESDSLRRRIVETRFGASWSLLSGQAFPSQLCFDADGSSQCIDPDGPVTFAVAGTGGYELKWQEDSAILDIPTFVRDREEEFTAFLETSFAEIASRGARRLVIDLRNNGGGAHDLSDKLMAYLTDKPWSPISAVTARITPANQAMIPGSEPGQVVSVPFQQIQTPPADLDNRFTGEVEIMIGPNSYSQAIVFAATAADHGVARLTGEPTSAPANQTGQVQQHVLPNSGFTVRAPIYILYRASGDKTRDPLRPDPVMPAR